MIKAYTDLEQSKKLAEILPLESADACWTNHLFERFLSSWRVESTPPQEYKCLLDRFVVSGYLIEPAWSLAALLSILPVTATLLKDANISNTGDIKYNCECSMVNIHKWFDNPVDACYEMIFKLNELKML